MSNQFWADIIRTAMGFLDRLASDYEAKLEAEKLPPLPTGQKGVPPTQAVPPVPTPPTQAVPTDPAQAQAQAQSDLPLAKAEGETSAFTSMLRPGVY